jgi:ATP-binding cassette subfamily C (CFTR/MRP) protein 1
MEFTTVQNCSRVDSTFGPWAGADCRSGFDFTLLFEESILSILPLALILCVTPVRIVYLWKKQNKVIKSKLLFTKLVRGVCTFFSS